jgi:hypothetical protein
MTTKIHWVGSQGGLGNRLMGVGAIMAASKSLKREITFTWVANHECPGDFESHFRFSMDHPPRVYNSKSGIDSIELVLNNPGLVPSQLCDELCRNNLVLPPKSEFLKSVALCLRQLVPTSCIDSVITTVSQRIPLQECLGIHIRQTDRNESMRKFPGARQLYYRIKTIGARETLHHLIADDSTTSKRLERRLVRKLLSPEIRDFRRVFLVADNQQGQEYFKSLLERHGFYVYTRYICFTDDQLRKTSLRDAVIDLYLLSSCKGILSNHNSSTFPLIAALLGGSRFYNYGNRHEMARFVSTGHGCN